MAVISTASEEAPRSGLYAKRSMARPSTVHSAIEIRIATNGGIPIWLTAMNTM